MLLAWCREVGLDDPAAAACFLAARLYRWNRRKLAEAFGRSRSTVSRWLPRGEAALFEAIAMGRIDGRQLRDLAERISGLGIAG